MNEKAAIAAVAAVLEGGKTAITSGIVHQGEQREIEEINKSNLTPPKQPYSISVDCTSARERSILTANVRTGVSYVEYSMELHISDPAYPQPSDSEQKPYETMHDDFRTVVGRIVKLIREDTVAFPSTTAKPKFIIRRSMAGDPAVTVENRSRWYDAGQGASPVLYSIIKFTIVDHCSDSSLV